MLEVNTPAILAEISAVVDTYEDALVRNDLEALDGFFWDAPQTIRFGVGENLYGFEAISAFRLARTGGSPPRRRLRTTITTFGADLATANVEFKREGSTRIGRQSQTWIRTKAGWRVVAAHVSLMADIS